MTAAAPPALDAATVLADAWGPALDRSYRLGRADGYALGRADEQAEQQRCWTTLRDHVQVGARLPQLEELRRLRAGEDHSLCPVACGRCSRCFHARAWIARGGRPYLGAAREAQLATTKPTGAA